MAIGSCSKGKGTPEWGRQGKKKLPKRARRTVNLKEKKNNKLSRGQ